MAAGAVNTRGYGRVGSVMGRLLLIAVLALGVFAMHTVGHPDDSHGAGASATTHASDAPDPPREQALPPEESLPHTSVADEPVMGMDMASLCVAVLSTWALAALLLAALARRADPLPAPPAGLAALPRPNPPPRTPELTVLSVLRI